MLVQHILRQVRAIRSGSTRVPHVHDGEVEVVMFMHVDDILDHAQATVERFAAELGEKFLRRDDKQDSSFFGGVNPLSKWMSRKLRRRRKIC